MTIQANTIRYKEWQPPNPRKKVRTVTIAIPICMVAFYKSLLKRGIYPSRSEAIRNHIIYGIRRDENLMKMLESLEDKESHGNEVIKWRGKEWTIKPRDEK
jgi:Arc/MetJ-type ribon-helix-helix transcriptional regulator